MSPKISSLGGTGVCIGLHFLSGGDFICCAECRVSNHGLLDTWGSGYPPNALTNNRIFNLTWTQSAVEPMRRTAKCALHAQLVCQRRATQSRSFQSDFVFCMQLSMGRTTLLMPISRRCCPFVGTCIDLHSLEDHGVLYASLLKSYNCGLDPILAAAWIALHSYFNMVLWLGGRFT